MTMFSQFGLPPSPKLSAPFPAWSNQRIQAVELAIATAWQHLKIDPIHQQTLASGTEVAITTLLLDAMTSLLNSNSLSVFSGQVFNAPIRGQELEDVTGTQLEKRPDISISLCASTPVTQHNSLFYECKRISPTATIANYANEGLIKFCDQRYAWGMSHAGMLAYVQDLDPAPQAEQSLVQFWINNPTNFTFPNCDVSVDTNGGINITITKHSRPLPLPNGNPSGEIAIRHLWLS